MAFRVYLLENPARAVLVWVDESHVAFVGPCKEMEGAVSCDVAIDNVVCHPWKEGVRLDELFSVDLMYLVEL